MRETFIQAFRTNFGGCRGECDCGKDYYSSNELSWDWDDGEYDFLEKDKNSFQVDSDVNYIEFNNHTYVIECDCWHHKAERFMNLINQHDAEIAKYLNAERERKIFEAERVQIIKVLSTPPEEEFDDDIPF